MKISIILLCLAPLFLMQQYAVGQKKVSKSDLVEVCKMMSGVFNSAKQSQQDSSFFNITLHMIPIWQHRTDGYWLYVEQAVTQQMHKPYRQRVYHVYLNGDKEIISQVYELKNPASVVGAWNEVMPLSHLTTDSLELRDGCAIHLIKTAKGKYVGSTPEKKCLSSLRGAAYATSEVTLTKNKIISWDRGWDNEDRQVWGATKGGYEFLKIENYK